MKRRKFLFPIATSLILISMYLVFVFGQSSFIENLRRVYIETAMGTLNYQWLATSLLPKSVVNEVLSEQAKDRSDQIGLNSQWQLNDDVPLPHVTDRESFYSVFHELMPDVTDQWLTSHPEYLALGWNNLVVPPGEAEGLTTCYGESVIAIDVPNRILLAEVEGKSSHGVLAVAKDPSALSIAPSSGIGMYGEAVGTITQQNGAVLGITCGAFHGANKETPGGDLAGFAMCNGTAYGTEHLPTGNKRIELRKNNLLYIVDTNEPVGEDCTDAAEFRPALIVDGEIVVKTGWAGLQPRVCLGQNDRYEILMLVMEGRQFVGGAFGASVLECANILKQHNAVQAINLDGGNSAMMWYRGEYLTRSSDPDHPDGRPVPTAVIYGSRN